MIVDATCAPSNIRYSQDVSLLNEARETAEKLLDVLHSQTDGRIHVPTASAQLCSKRIPEVRPAASTPQKRQNHWETTELSEKRPCRHR